MYIYSGYSFRFQFITGTTPCINVCTLVLFQLCSRRAVEQYKQNFYGENFQECDSARDSGGQDYLQFAAKMLVFTDSSLLSLKVSHYNTVHIHHMVFSTGCSYV